MCVFFHSPNSSAQALWMLLLGLVNCSYLLLNPMHEFRTKFAKTELQNPRTNCSYMQKVVCVLVWYVRFNCTLW